MQTLAHASRSLIRSLSASLLLAGAIAAQGTSLETETWGRASGDVPLPGLGLVLELHDPGTPAARLVLSGGSAGHPAAIVLSATKPAGPASGARGTTTLVGPTLERFQGAFDWDGTYSVPCADLAALPAGAVLFAQGSETGILDFGGAGPFVQLSHGLEIRAEAVGAEEPLAFDDLLPHLPERAELGNASDVADLLQRMLNSAGDSLRLAVEVEATAGLGVEVVTVKAGGKLAIELTVERAPDGLYEVVVAADLAALAGASAGTGAEAGIEAAQGYGGSSVYRFASAPGAARGLLGLIFAARFPGLQPGRILQDSGILGDAGAHVATLQEGLRWAQEHRDDLEHALRGALEANVRAAESLRAGAYRLLADANARYARASWRERPGAFVRVLACRMLVLAADVNAATARAARERGERALDAAKAVVEARRAELFEALRGIGKVGRVASALVQLGGYTSDHYAGSELRSTRATEVEAKVGVPCVEMKNVGVSVAGEVEQAFVTRWEVATATEPARVTILQRMTIQGTLAGGNLSGMPLLGGELVRERTIEIARSFELGTGAGLPSESSITLENDTCLVGAIGAVLAYETGVGRSRSFALAGETADALDLASLFAPEDVGGRVAAATIGFDLQDRRQRNVDFALSVDVNGWGGGVEIEMEWADQGRLLSRETTLREGIETLLNGASQVIDDANGAILSID